MSQQQPLHSDDQSVSPIEPAQQEEEKSNENNKPNNLRSNRPIAAAVDVHPLVLLSVVDHFARINSRVSTKKRVVGLLLGTFIKDAARGGVVLDINNCFAVPFDEDMKKPEVYFLDTNYAEDMFHMYKKVLPKVQVVGWYSSGPTISNNDLDLHLLVADRFCPNPVYCIVNTDTTKKGVPVLAYTITSDATGSGKGGDAAGGGLAFRNITTSLGSLEAEDIGVEHLLRDLTDSTITTLSTRISDRQIALRHMENLLKTVEDYLVDVADEKLPVSEDVLAPLQEVINLQPIVHSTKKEPTVVLSTNDQVLATFVAAATRCVMGLYDVILNRRRLSRELKELQEKRDETHQQKKEELLSNKKKEGAPSDDKKNGEKSKKEGGGE